MQQHRQIDNKYEISLNQKKKFPTKKKEKQKRKYLKKYNKVLDIRVCMYKVRVHYPCNPIHTTPPYNSHTTVRQWSHHGSRACL